MSGVTGAGRLRRDATIVGNIGGEVGRELQAAIDKPIAKLRRACDQRIADFPKRGGYAGVYGAAFRIKVSATAGDASLRVKLTGTAKGRSRIRDSAALNRGVLRHMTFGRATSAWHSQGVKAGFWDLSAASIVGDVRDAAEVAVAKAAKTTEAQL